MKVQCEKVSGPFRGDTLRLFQSLGGGQAETVLLESMDGSGTNNVKSLLFVGNALRIEARGDNVEIRVLSESGARVLDRLSEPAGETVEFASQRLSSIGEVERTASGLSVRVAKRKREGTDLERISAVSVVDVLRFFQHNLTPADSEETVFFPGVFAYDLIDSLEDLPPSEQDPLSFPDYVFWLPEKTVVVDHLQGLATAYIWQFGDAATPQAGDTLAELKRKIEAAHETIGTEDDRAESSVTLDGLAQVDLEDADFETLVDRMKNHIVSGDVFQIVPSRTFSLPCPDPLRAYVELRKLNPSPYMFVVCGPNFCLFGASPESCVNVSTRPHKLILRPIAGTRPRGFSQSGKIDKDLDNRFEVDLKLDEKELAEHMMLVDLARNDVSRICAGGSRHVVRLLDVERYSHVMHLVSAVEGALRAEFDALHAYRASMNMGTLVGAPKIEAARLLRKYEKNKRGPYGGAVGYFSSTGELDTAIVIRSALVKDNIAYVRAGAGVVFDSDPAAEARETRNKAKAVLLAIERAKES